MKARVLIAALLLACLWPLDSGSYPSTGNTGGSLDANDYGIVGEVASEQTLTALYNLKQIKAPERTGGYTTIYVSAEAGGRLPLGVDTNDGSMANPILTMDRVTEILTERACGIEIVLDTDTWTGATNWGAGLGVFSPDCTDTDEVAVYIHSIDPDIRAIFDCTGGSATEAIQVGGAGGGWAVFEGIHIEGCAIDGFNTTTNAKVVVLNSGGNVSGGNQVFTPHVDSDMILVNVYGTATDGAQIYAGTATTRTSIITDKNFFLEDTGGHAGEQGLAPIGGTGLVIGPALVSVAGSTTQRMIQQSPGANVPVNFTYARVSGRCIVGAVDSYSIFLNAGANDTSTLTMYQSTFGDCYYGVYNLVSDASGSSTVTIRGSIFDEIERVYHASDANDSARSTIDISQTVHDEDDGAGASYRCDSTYYATMILGLAGDCSNYTAFFTEPAPGDYDSGTPTVDGEQWQNTAGTVELPRLACNPDSECYLLGYEDPYTLTMPTAMPEFVLGKEFTYFTLNGAGGKIGAR